MALSEQIRRRPDATYLAWYTDQAKERFWTSVLSLAEIERGVPGFPTREARVRTTAWLAEAEEALGPRILPVDRAVTRRWVDIWVRHAELGLEVGVVDELIAATAIVHDLTVVTRNVRDFEHAGCKVLSPWSA